MVYRPLKTFFVVTLLLFGPCFAFASPGTEHALDMLQVLLGPERVKAAEVQGILREFTKTIDNFDVVKGLPLGREGHRVYGHWGFAGDIPFEKEPLKGVLDRIATNEGEAARRTAISAC